MNSAFAMRAGEFSAPCKLFSKNRTEPLDASGYSP